MSGLSVPLPFTAALLAGLLVVVLLRESAAGPRARTLFGLFFAAIGILAALSGLNATYQLSGAWRVGSVVAMTLGPLSYLAFRALTAAAWPGWRVTILRHGWPVAAAALLVWRGRLPIDPAIAASFLVYAVLLARLRAQGADVLIETPLGDTARTLRMLTSTICMNLLSALLQLSIFGAVLAGAPGLIPSLLGGFTLVLIAVLGWALLGRAARPEAATAPAPQPAEPATDEDAKLVAALEALLAGQSLYRDPGLTLARLARRLGVPARGVSQAVNRARGMNVSQFINNFRVAEAQRLLRDTGQPVTEIMLAAGFQTKSNFNREFRRVTGDSPSGWRGRDAA